MFARNSMQHSRLGHNFHTIYSRLAVGVSIVLSFFISACSCSDDKDRIGEEQCQLVENSLTALYQGDIQSYMASADYGVELDTLHTRIIESLLSRHVRQVNEIGGMKQVATTGVSFDSDSVAVVSYTLTYNNGTRESHLQKVVNTGDGWKLRIVE